MRSILIFLIALPLAAFAAPEQSPKPWPGDASCCDVMNCSHEALPFDPPTPAKDLIHDATSPDSEAVSPVIAKGGRGGGGGGHRDGVGGGGAGAAASSANSKSVSNPFAVLRGPLLVLNSVLTTTRAHISLGGESMQARDAEFVGKKI